MKEVIEFIKIFQSPSNEILFKECACYWFSNILSQRFNNSTIMYNPDEFHFATMIEDTLYDIAGVIEDSSGYIVWDLYYRTSSDADMIYDTCILLKGGEYS